MSKVAALCSCGKPPVVGVAVIAYALPWKKPGRQKTSRTFHLCDDCARERDSAEKFTALANAFQSSYEAVTE